VWRVFIAFLRALAFHEIVMANVDDGERRGLRVRLGIFQEPAQKKFFRTFEARLAEKKQAEQQHDEH
jgi:hypothetical protein